MIAPPPALIISGIPCRQQRNVPSRSSDCVWFHTPMSTSVTVCPRPSNRRHNCAGRQVCHSVFTVCWIALLTLSSFVTSVSTKVASPPAARTDCSHARPSSGLSSAMTTFAPSRVKMCDAARAIPGARSGNECDFPLKSSHDAALLVLVASTRLNGFPQLSALIRIKGDHAGLAQQSARHDHYDDTACIAASYDSGVVSPRSTASSSSRTTRNTRRMYSVLHCSRSCAACGFGR